MLLTIGRLVERKGVETVISCLPDLIGKYPDVVCLIVGFGPLEERFRRLVGALNLEKHVIFAGAVSAEELPSHYRLADILIMASQYLKKKSSVEGLGLAYLEAGASGIPIIAGHSGGVPDAVRNNENGLLVDPEVPGETCAAIDRLLGDLDLAHALGKNGRDIGMRIGR